MTTQTTLKTITRVEAWEMTNDFVWDEDPRFEALHDALLYAYTEGGSGYESAFLEVLEEVFNATTDFYAPVGVDEEGEPLEDFDIVDGLDNLAHGNYSGLDQLEID